MNGQHKIYDDSQQHIGLQELKPWFKYKSSHNDNVYIKKNKNKYKDKSSIVSVYEEKETFYFKDDDNNVYELVRQWSSGDELIRLVGTLLTEADTLLIGTRA